MTPTFLLMLTVLAGAAFGCAAAALSAPPATTAAAYSDTETVDGSLTVKCKLPPQAPDRLPCDGSHKVKP